MKNAEDFWRRFSVNDNRKWEKRRVSQISQLRGEKKRSAVAGYGVGYHKTRPLTFKVVHQTKTLHILEL